MLAVGVLTGLLFGLGGTASYAIGTASVAHSGSIPTVGATATSSTGMGGGTGGGMGDSAPTGTAPKNGTGSAPKSGTKLATGSSSSSNTSSTGGSAKTNTGTSSATSTSTGGGQGPTNSSKALTALLTKAGTKWSAAVDGSQSAATLELSSNTAVLAIGGWSSDPTPTLSQFKALVAAGKVHYYIASSTTGGSSGGTSTSTSSVIATWVKAHFTATTVGSTTVYNLTTAN